MGASSWSRSCWLNVLPEGAWGAAVCVDAGLVLVTVTGGFGAPSDEARYTGEAVEILELVLGRL